MDEEWAANSYLDDGLDVYGTKHPVTVDTRLRDAVAPWIDAKAPMERGDRPAGVHSRSEAQSTDVDWDNDGNPAETAEIVAQMREVEGWLRDEEAELLIRVVRHALKEQDVATVVEIGSYCGKSTAVLARAAKAAFPLARVYAVDPHEGEIGDDENSVDVSTRGRTLERFLANISAAGVTDLVQPIVQRSADVPWKGPIALLFIDGLHDYLSVSRDFGHFERWLPSGAYVAFHDCDDHYPGVRACVAGILSAGGYREIRRAHSLVVLQKLVGSASLTSEPGAKDLASLRIRAAQQDKGITFLMSELAKRGLTIREREEGIDWLRSVVETHEATIAEQEKGIAWLREVVAERDKSILWLQREVANHARAVKELEGLKRSRSWRLLEFFHSFRGRHA